MIRLDRRLRSVVDRIVGARCVADVGTDHGKVVLKAIEEGRAERGIATDISAKSLAKAAELARRLGIEISTRCGDGLEPLSPGEADTIVIAGMGGLEISGILSRTRYSAEKYILVPHNNAPLLRRYLVENGYRIDADEIVRSGKKFYPIVTAAPGDGSITLRQEYFGRGAAGEGDTDAYVKYRKGVIETIAHGMSGGMPETLAREAAAIEEYENES